MSSLLTDRALLWLGALLYLAGFLTGLVALTRRSAPAGLRTILNTFLVGGWIFQMAGLYVRGLAVGGCPLGNTFEIVQFVAWSAMVLYFFVGATPAGQDASKAPANHSPKFFLDEGALKVGMASMLQATLDYLDAPAS